MSQFSFNILCCASSKKHNPDLSKVALRVFRWIFAVLTKGISTTTNEGVNASSPFSQNKRLPKVDKIKWLKTPGAGSARAERPQTRQCQSSNRRMAD